MNAAGYDSGRMSKGVGVAPALGEAIDWYQLSCATRTGNFDPRKFLATIGEGRRVVAFPKRQTIFSAGFEFMRKPIKTKNQVRWRGVLISFGRN
jgi:hypothetical protein